MALKQRPSNNSNRDILKYAGLGTQILVSIGLAVFVGIKGDEWLKFSTPLLTWILPLLVIIGIIWQVIKETTKPRDK